MGLLLGTVAWLAGTVQVGAYFHQLRRANPTEKISLFSRRPTNYPGEIYAYQAIAVFLLMLSAYAWMDLLGIWAALLPLISGVPIAILNVQHNRHVQAAATSTARMGAQ